MWIITLFILAVAIVMGFIYYQMMKDMDDWLG